MPAAAELPLICQASFKPKACLDPAAACEAVRRALAAASKRKVRLTGSSAAGPSDHLAVSLSMPRANAVLIAAKGKLHGRTVAYGPVALDVMDRPIGQADVERLAKTMAETVGGR